MLRKLGKRGDIDEVLFYMIIQALLLVGTVMFILAFIIGMYKLTLLEKHYFSRDVSLLINTMYAAPGNVYYTYPGDFSKYDFKLSLVPYTTAIYENNPSSAIRYPFAQDKAMNFEYKEEISFEKNERLKLVKELSTIKADKLLDFNPQILKCPTTNTRDSIGGKKLVIDPGHLTEPADLGEVNGDSNEAGEMLEIARAIQGAARGLNVILTREDAEREIQKRLEIIENENPDIVISLHANDKEENVIEVHVNPGAEEEIQEKGKKLGCMIINEIAGNSELKNIGFYAVNPIAKTPSEEVLVADRVSIALFIGNIQTTELFEKKGIIANSILAGIEDYYK